MAQTLRNHVGIASPHQDQRLIHSLTKIRDTVEVQVKGRVAVELKHT